MQAFLVGGITALAFGYYRVHQDVWSSAALVEKRIHELGHETVATQTAFEARVAALEKELSRLKATRGPGSA